MDYAIANPPYKILLIPNSLWHFWTITHGEIMMKLPQDFSRIAVLNAQYADLPGDFADLTFIAISERLDICAIATLDSDFDVYPRYRKKPFERVFWSEGTAMKLNPTRHCQNAVGSPHSRRGCECK